MILYHKIKGWQMVQTLEEDPKGAEAVITLKQRQPALYFDVQLNRKPVKFLKERCRGLFSSENLKIQANGVLWGHSLWQIPGA